MLIRTNGAILLQKIKEAKKERVAVLKSYQDAQSKVNKLQTKEASASVVPNVPYESDGRWLVQIDRLPKVFKDLGLAQSFEDPTIPYTSITRL